MARTIGFDELTLRLIAAGVGQDKLKLLAAIAAQELRGGVCPECGSKGDHETNGTDYQCANGDCLSIWRAGENAPSLEDLLESLGLEGTVRL